LGTAKNPLGTHKFTTPARVLSDDTFEFASKWEYVFAVVEKSLCPSHTCMSFNVIPFVLPLFNSNDAQVCRRSWKRISRSSFFFNKCLNAEVMSKFLIILYIA